MPLQSPLLHMEQHTGVGPLNLPEGSLMDLSAAPRRESGSTFLSDARKSGSLDGWKEVEASASNCSTLSGSEVRRLLWIAWGYQGREAMSIGRTSRALCVTNRVEVEGRDRHAQS